MITLSSAFYLSNLCWHLVRLRSGREHRVSENLSSLPTANLSEGRAMRAAHWRAMGEGRANAHRILSPHVKNPTGRRKLTKFPVTDHP